MLTIVCFGLLLVVATGVDGDLAADVKTLQSRLHKLEEQQFISSTYCNLFARGKCGKCLCRDDFKIPKKYYCDCRAETPRRDCRDFNDNGYRNIDGLYVVTMNGYKNTVVYCDQSWDNGGWTVIQRRFDGSENFYRGWEAYKRGFGELQREFWLGNDDIHLLTAQAVYPQGSEARLRMSHDNGFNFVVHQYTHFQVNSEKTKYTLHLTSLANNIDPFASSDKQEFSTYDQDNDGASSHHCAKDVLYAGWWINGSGDSCNSTKSNLNGPFDALRERAIRNRMHLKLNSPVANAFQILVRRL